MTDGITRWKSKGGWQSSPFDGLEKRLPVNFIAAKEYSKQILQKLKDPKKSFTGKSSRDVIQYVNELRQGRFVRQNLRHYCSRDVGHERYGDMPLWI